MLNPNRALRVLVLCGGPSEEREISLLSGRAVADACRDLGHEVTVSDISQDDLLALEQEFDLVFPVLHGEFGEDGQLQQILEGRGISFVGSGAQASEKAFDKGKAKQAFVASEIPTPDFIVTSEPIEKLPNGSRFCCKPACQGSSIGIEFANSLSEVNSAITKIVQQYGGEVVVEEFIAGRELTVGILGDIALPIVEIEVQTDFYDFEAKYQRKDTQYPCPAELTSECSEKIRALAQKAFERLGCRDFGRVDLILSESNEPQFLEVNTIPGFTEQSLLPKAAEQAGISFNQLVDRLIRCSGGIR
jgi:D-alanine-D-alanine ligase